MKANIGIIVEKKYQDGTSGKSSAKVLEFTEVTDLLQARSIAADWTGDNRFLDVEESPYEKNHYFVPITSTARFFLEII